MEWNLFHVDGKDSEILEQDKVSDVGDWSGMTEFKLNTLYFLFFTDPPFIFFSIKISKRYDTRYIIFT